MKPDTKLMTFVISAQLILMVMLKCSVGAEAVDEDMPGSAPIDRPWPQIGRPETSTRPQPKSSQSVPRLSILEEDVQEASTQGQYETWTGPKEPFEVANTHDQLEKAANLSIQQDCSAWNFSNVDLITLFDSCPPLVSGISAECCTELVNIARDISACFCALIETLFGASLGDIIELPTLQANCTELSNPCP